MIDPQTTAVLQDLVRREARSVLMYVGDAFPWTAARDGAALVRVRELIRAESDAVNAVVQFLQRNRVPLTSHGSYPASFTTINFLALDYLLPRLAAYERSSLPGVEADRARLFDPTAQAIVDRLLDVKRQNLAALEALAAHRPTAATA